MAKNEASGRGGEDEVDRLAVVGLLLPFRPSGKPFGSLCLPPLAEEFDHCRHELMFSERPAGLRGTKRRSLVIDIDARPLNDGNGAVEFEVLPGKAKGPR